MRNLSKALIAGACLAIALPAAAVAQPATKAPAGAADVRCLLTMVALSQQKDRQQAGQAGAYYFAGRISARGPAYDLAGAIRTEAAHMDIKTLEAESKRCGPMITASMQSVKAGLDALRVAGPPPAGAQAAPPAAALPAPTPQPR